MKTLNSLKNKANRIVSYMDTRIKNGNANPARMKRLLDILRNTCFEIAKYEEKTASALFEVADIMVSEVIESTRFRIIQKEINVKEKDIQWDSYACNDEDCVISKSVTEWIEPLYPTTDCDDEHCDPLHHYKEKFLQEPLYRGNDE